MKSSGFSLYQISAVPEEYVVPRLTLTEGAWDQHGRIHSAPKFHSPLAMVNYLG
ncbi:protein of unknown function [Methylotuvimicrobium alcaliphilum 20Z]|uniref:Uncharacterized protein n=1 Tax=Methylotuvimicrobium alcaliphilum (strain DSM 19304 / NCIMB 14124 / VKM B-2133 / 20Z) TaxID=1091494 RepID=G4T2I2_META2|nr:protein of unknown function [Methylotuvimicrobium alcaliphilum 20Z]